MKYWDCAITHRIYSKEAKIECMSCAHCKSTATIESNTPLFLHVECTGFASDVVHLDPISYPCPNFNPVECHIDYDIELKKGKDYQEIPDTLRLT